MYSLNTGALRLAKARLARAFPRALVTILGVLGGLGFAAGLGMLILGLHAGLIGIGLALMALTVIIWVHRDLYTLPQAAIGSSKALDQLLPLDVLAGLTPTTTPAQAWAYLGTSPAGMFMANRLGLDQASFATALGTTQTGMQDIWAASEKIASDLGRTVIDSSVVLAALATTPQETQNLLTKLKLDPVDVIEVARWHIRLTELTHLKKPVYGGIARDWASGFTPLLSHFGENLSLAIESAAGRMQSRERTSQLDDLITSLDSATGSIVLIGDPGIGKSALLLGLAERLLQGTASRGLTHYQIYSLSASSIISSANQMGDIERIVMELLEEAAHAGNIIIALDEAQLFFGQGTGAVNLSQVLLPVLQAHSFKVVLTFTPGDWQRLKATNPAMSSLLTPLILTEPPQVEVIRDLAERALYLEQGKVLTTYSALQSAYRLSGRYYQDEAYPGRALKLLEAALNHPDGTLISARSVEQAVESQFGVKVQQASAAESDVLLHLEDKIHERMINQTRAVSVVAGALRRARAGVANPKRPIGSFLFLGPTGVGKTELAKSIAALYFGSESNIVRLDMSEYQQVVDVDRILASAAENPDGLLPRVRQTPFSVVLFDEIEKAHPNILNLFLQLLDEGNLTDTSSHPTSFKDAIIIATSNAGADALRERIEAGQKLEDFEQEFTNELIDSGLFRPEFLNRFDEIVLFRPLNEAELGQVVRLMVAEVNKTLANQKITVALTDDAVADLVTTGYDPRLGARPMRRMVQRKVEDTVADMILRGEAQPGDTITLSAAQLGGGAAAADAPSESLESVEPTTDQMVANQKQAPENPAPVDDRQTDET